MDRSSIFFEVTVYIYTALLIQTPIYQIDNEDAFNLFRSYSLYLYCFK